MADLRHVDAWVFDLDNTLYPADCNLFRQIDQRMTSFIEDNLALPADEARLLQKRYYVEYGTTMSGLMREHAVRPAAFLEFVHDIDLSPVEENRLLASRIMALPGRKFVFTNGSVQHAENVMAKIGVAHCFDAVFDIEAADYTPKPHRETYEKFLTAHAITAPGAIMFEDIAHNLESAHSLGMTTVLVSSEADWIADEPDEKRPARAGDKHDYVHHVTDDLTDFLGVIKTSAATRAKAS